MINALNLLQSATIIEVPGKNNDQPQDITLRSSGKSLDSAGLIGNFSFSNNEDDDEESGFCCPCCLPR